MIKSRMHKVFLITWLVFNTLFNGFSQTESVKGEIAFLNVDKDIYIAGENVLFSVNLLDLDNNSSTSHIAYLALRNENNQIITKANISFENGSAWSSIYLPDTLSTGYYQLVTFTNYMRNFSENYYDFKQILVVNRFDKSFERLHMASNDSVASVEKNKKLSGKHTTISFDKDIYGIGEDVNATIHPQYNGVESISVSIVPVNSCFLNNHKKGLYTSHEMPSNGGISRDSLIYKKEQNGVYLSGTMLCPSKKEPQSNVRLFLSTPDSLANIKYTSTDSIGRFNFHLSSVYQGREVFIIPDTSIYQGDVDIFLDDKFQIQSQFIANPIQVSDSLIDFIKRSQDIVRFQKEYEVNQTISEKPPLDNITSLPQIYSTPTYEYKLSNYEPLEDLYEISREIIPYLRIRKKKDTIPILRLLNDQKAYSTFANAPEVFINGVPRVGIEKLLKLGSESIDKIEVLNKPWVYGELYFDGIISVFLNNNVEIKPLIEEKVLLYKVGVLLNRTKLKPLQYSQQSSGSLPDIRQVLHWDPCVSVNNDNTYSFEFNTGYLQGYFAVIVNGILSNGQEFREVKRISVQNMQ